MLENCIDGICEMNRIIVAHFENLKIHICHPLDYENVCKTVLKNYSVLAEHVKQSCSLENANPSKKACKRLQSHVKKII